MPSQGSSSPAKRRKLHHGATAGRGRGGRARTSASIWNSTDDWDELVAASSLSTSSISTRPPRPRGLHSLAKTAEDVAVRKFRMLYEDGKYPWGSGGVGDGVDDADDDEDDEGRGKIVKKKKVQRKTQTSRDREKEARQREQAAQKGWWELQWPHVPDHLKARVRDGVMRMHGSYLSLDVVRKLFLFPPEYVLPGHLLPALCPPTKSTSASASSSTAAPGLRTIPLRPHPVYCKGMHTLKVQHCASYSDAAVADMINLMPALQVVNLKGCSLVARKTVDAICSLRDVRRVNLKGTRVDEADVQRLLECLGDRVEGFKVDDVVFRDADEAKPQPCKVFTSTYPRLTHLCLPGTIINGPRNTSADARARVYNHTVSTPVARPRPAGATFTWAAFGETFPSLTHLYLPGLLIPSSERIMVEANTLAKLSLGTGGPAVPTSTLFDLLSTQGESLRKLHIGHLEPNKVRHGPSDVDAMNDCINGLEKLEEFRWIRDAQAKVSAACEGLMKAAAEALEEPLARNWAWRLKHLHLELGHPFYSEVLFNAIKSPHHPALDSNFGFELVSADETALESLSLPSTSLAEPVPLWVSQCELSDNGAAGTAKDMADRLARVSPYWAIRLFPKLRTLDLSGTDITTEQVYDILDKCPLLSRVDLTSCRGVDVRLRRRIFVGWEESRSVDRAKGKK